MDPRRECPTKVGAWGPCEKSESIPWVEWSRKYFVIWMNEIQKIWTLYHLAIIRHLICCMPRSRRLTVLHLCFHLADQICLFSVLLQTLCTVCNHLLIQKVISSESLIDYFECTDWNILWGSQGNSMDTDSDRMVDCRDTVLPARTVKCFPITLITFYILWYLAFYPKRLTTVHTHIHTPMAEPTTQGDSQLVRGS